MTDERVTRGDVRLSEEEREAIRSCDCGHGLWEHNGLGCYAVVAYAPNRVTCPCPETDDRPSVNFEAVERIVAARVGEVVERVEALADAWSDPEWGGRLTAAPFVRAIRSALHDSGDDEATP